jgi:hypothetical protein
MEKGYKKGYRKGLQFHIKRVTKPLFLGGDREGGTYPIFKNRNVFSPDTPP